MSVFLALVASLFVFALPASAHIASRTPRLLEAPLQRYKLNLGRVKPQTVRNAAKYFAEKDLDVAGVNFQSRTVELIIPSQVASEIRTRFNVEVVPVAEEGMAVDPRFVNPERLEAKMTALAKANPDLVSLHVLGKSTEGRPILALQITKPGPAIKPAILIDGNHHAREIMTPEVAFDVAETLVTAAKSSPPSVRRNILSVLERAEIWVLPMLNPDGNNIVWKSDTW